MKIDEQNIFKIINSIVEKIKASQKEDYRVSCGDVIDYLNENCPQTPLVVKARTYCHEKLRDAKCYNDNFFLSKL